MTVYVNRGVTQCDASWHIRNGWLPLAIYNKICAITYNKIAGTYGTYFASGRALADFYGADEDHVTKVLRTLRKAKWLQIVGYGPGAVIEEGDVERSVKSNCYKPKNYHPLQHHEWAENHPGKCFEKEQMVWDCEDHDSLARRLWKASLGKTTWYANMLAGLRSSGMTDDEIVQVWETLIQSLPTIPVTSRDWRRLARKFIHEVQICKLVAR